MEVSDQLHALVALPQYPLHRRLHGPQNQSGLGGEKKKSLSLLGNKPQSSNPQFSHYLSLKSTLHQKIFQEEVINLEEIYISSNCF
jgi:hypothetical protein